MAKQALNQYFVWEGEHRIEHNKLIDEYNSLKEKELMISEQTNAKGSKKEMLLEMKANTTLSKLDNLKLWMLEKDMAIDAAYDRNIQLITEKRERAIKEAELAFEKAKSYYDCEKDLSTNKAKREYDGKKRILESRGEAIENEKSFVFKTATEITLEKQKHDLLVKLKKSIGVWKMSRSQLPGNPKFDMPIPELPEPIVERLVKKRAESNVEEEFTPPPMPDWLQREGEDPELAVLREQARQEEAEFLRKQQMQEETSRKTVYGFVGSGVGAQIRPVENERQTIIFEDCIDAS